MSAAPAERRFDVFRKARLIHRPQIEQERFLDVFNGWTVFSGDFKLRG